MKQRIINNIVVLGRSCPDVNSKGEIVVCMAGYSLAEGAFIRLYPIVPKMKIRRWDVIQADCEQSADRRFESWKLRGDLRDIPYRVRKTGVYGKGQRVKLLEKIKSNCVTEISEAKRSLGVVVTRKLRGTFQPNNKHYGMFQAQLFGTPDYVTRNDYPYRPYYEYTCEGPTCNGHEQQLVEWGAHEYLRKNPHSGDKLWDALSVYSNQHKHYLLVGNLAAHRTAYMVISDLRQKVAQMEMAI